MNIPRPQYNLFQEHKMRIKYFSTTSYTKTVCVDVWSPSHTLWGDNSCGGLFLLHVIQGVYWCNKYLIILLHSKILQHWLWLKQCGSRFKVIKREQNTACEQHVPTMQFWPQFSKILDKFSRYHWWSMAGISRSMHCGILFNMTCYHSLGDSQLTIHSMML